jgi:hypothetical protein
MESTAKGCTDFVCLNEVIANVQTRYRGTLSNLPVELLVEITAQILRLCDAGSLAGVVQSISIGEISQNDVGLVSRAQRALLCR